MSEQDEEDLVSAIEREAGLPAGLLSSLLELERKYPDLKVRRERKNLYRSIELIMDEAADRVEAK